MQVTQSRSDTPIDKKLAEWGRWLVMALLATAFALVLATLFVPPFKFYGNPNVPEVALILFATTGTIIELSRQLPLQNVFLAASVIAIVGGGISAIGVASGIPFGPFIFTSEIGPELFKLTPWAIPLIWIVVILNSRGVARLILRPWRKVKTYGFWLIGLTAFLTMLFDFAFDPFASRIKHYWFWTPTKFPLTWQSAPLVNFLSWGIITLLILAFITPALINKQLSRRNTPDFHPLCVWIGGILIFGIACGKNGFWSAVAVDAAIGFTTIIFAIRGARW